MYAKWLQEEAQIVRAIVQRVQYARLRVDDQEMASIGPGLLVYASVAEGDCSRDCEYLARKIVGLRIFPDEAGRFNLDLLQTKGEVLLVSNFTLHGDTRKGRRPSFAAAAQPQQAQTLLDELAEYIRRQGLSVAQGRFAAHMHVESVNDGPVNILLDSSIVF